MKKLRIALTKGRLEKKSVELFQKMGIDCDELINKGRRLILNAGDYEVVLAKAADVITYVEHGVCDIGIVGKDTLLEAECDLYEMLDLKFEKCKLSVAGFPGKAELLNSPNLRVATKYVNTAKKMFLSRGEDVEIIKLNGSIEIAPILGLSDVIVDIVESGKTLKENNLRVYEQIMPISARLIANKSSYKFKGKDIDTLMEKLTKELAK
jgi:ATP phosphoribosyltransferase